jgi:hypothetical protein
MQKYKGLAISDQMVTAVKSQFNSQFHMGSLDDVILQALQLNSSL